jgi:hypothetical protein
MRNTAPGICKWRGSKSWYDLAAHMFDHMNRRDCSFELHSDVAISNPAGPQQLAAVDSGRWQDF